MPLCGIMCQRLRDFLVSVALLSSGRNSPDRVLDIPAAVNTAPKSIEAIKDYQEARERNCGGDGKGTQAASPTGAVVFYRDAGAYQAALAAELKTRELVGGNRRRSGSCGINWNLTLQIYSHCGARDRSSYHGPKGIYCRMEHDAGSMDDSG